MCPVGFLFMLVQLIVEQKYCVSSDVYGSELGIKRMMYWSIKDPVTYGLQPSPSSPGAQSQDCTDRILSET